MLLAASYSLLGRDVAVVGVAVAVPLMLAFLAHTDLSLTRKDDASEFAVDVRATEQVEPFRETLGQLAASRTAPLLIDPELAEPLAWYLRDMAVTFDAPSAEAGLVVVRGGTDVEGFTPTGGEWLLGEGWYPTDIDPLPLWRWLVYREAYGTLTSMTTVEAQILVPAP